MPLRNLIIPLVFAGLASGSASAGPIGDLFGRKPKVEPVTRVPALLTMLTSEKDERVRAAAAEELALYDPKQFAELSPGLVGSLQNDTSAQVRVAAATALGKLRPTSQEAGFALEQAAANDAVPRVKAAANAALTIYKLAGVAGNKAADPRMDQSEEPPLASPYDQMPKVKSKPGQGATAKILPVQPVKAEPKREGLFVLPSWLGGREKAQDLPKVPVLPRSPAVEKSTPDLVIPQLKKDDGPSLTPPKL